jgi:hypothetical protein
MRDGGFKKSQEEADRREREQGCICDRETPQGKVDKARGRPFVPKAGCRLHGWMVRDEQEPR